MAGTFNPDILIFNVSMADIPMTTGYSPNQWREGLNVMLFPPETAMLRNYRKSFFSKPTSMQTINGSAKWS